jgi:hypothetical protein
LKTAVCPVSPPGTREELNISSTGAILQEEEEPVILDETKATFYAVAELAV